MSDLRMISVGEILRNLSDASDIGRIDTPEDFFGLFAAKVSHDHFDWLADRIMEQGFTVPICIHENGSGWSVGNGHHRLCAAILLGLDTIPVFWGDSWEPDSHDGEQAPDNECLTDYWDLLSQNMEGEHYGNHDSAWRRQYFSGDDDDDESCDCDDCRRAQHPECTLCGADDCDREQHLCEECGEYADAPEMHRIGCHAADWQVVYCYDEACSLRGLGQYRYRKYQACEHIRMLQWDAAMAEHVLRGFPALGAWHPASVLAEAYAEEAQWEADRALREARERHERALARVRDAVKRGAGDFRLMIECREAIETEDAYMAL
jgi:hypothetical protein